MGELRIVHLLDVRADVPQAHAQPIQTDDLVLEAVGQNRLTLLDQLRLEAAMAVLWSVNLKAASGAFDGLAAFAIAFVAAATDRKSTRLNSSHVAISYAVFCLKKKNSSHTTSHTGDRPANNRNIKNQIQ